MEGEKASNSGATPGPGSGDRAIRVLVVDDHAIVREGLCAILETEAGIDVAGQAANAKEALQKCRALRPDVTLLDVHLHGESGLDVLSEMQGLDPTTKILMISAYDHREDVHRARASGARGYILKDTCAGDLIAAIRAVHGCEQYWLSGLDGVLVEPLDRAAASSMPGGKV